MVLNLNVIIIFLQSIKCNVFINLVWDNIDRLEEIIIGGGIMYRVNGIVVQLKVYGSYFLNVLRFLVEKRKQRSIILESLLFLIYIFGDKVGLQLFIINCFDNLR